MPAFEYHAIRAEGDEEKSFVGGVIVAAAILLAGTFMLLNRGGESGDDVATFYRLYEEGCTRECGSLGRVETDQCKAMCACITEQVRAGADERRLRVLLRENDNKGLREMIEPLGAPAARQCVQELR